MIIVEVIRINIIIIINTIIKLIHFLLMVMLYNPLVHLQNLFLVHINHFFVKMVNFNYDVHNTDIRNEVTTTDMVQIINVVNF